MGDWLLSGARRGRVSVSVAVVLLCAGCGGGTVVGAQPTPRPEESMATDLPTSRGSRGLDCGALFEGEAGGDLKVTGRFPAAVPARQQLLNGSVDIAGTGSGARGVVTPQAEAFLVREGRIVTLPVPQDAVGRVLDLSDGRVEQMPAMADLTPCAGGASLPPGQYDLYVRVVVNRQDGTRADSLGGPWPLEVG